jgi:hypothetical protein
MRRSSLVVSLVVGALLVPVAVFASHQFNDVPDSHIFHTGISWMKDNNITVGCNPPANTNFCPDDNVTRGQMATFMKRLAENNVVDAATLDGLDSTEVRSLVWASTDAGTPGTTITAGPAAEINSVDIDVPVDGVLVISGTSFLNNLGPAAIYRLRPFVDGSTVDSHQAAIEVQATGAAGDQVNVSYTVTVPITAGEHTVSQTIGQTADATFFFNRNHLTVTFVAAGSVSAAVVGEDAGGDPDGS